MKNGVSGWFSSKQVDNFREKLREAQWIWHLVYDLFDTSRGGYHPQMEPVVNTSILKSIERNMVEEK